MPRPEQEMAKDEHTRELELFTMRKFDASADEPLDHPVRTERSDRYCPDGTCYSSDCL